MSPYLFIICADGLLTLLRKADRVGMIVGAKVARGTPRVNHLLFTDDSLIFEEVIALGASNLKVVLTTYATCSGQLVNFKKSSLFFSSNVIDSNCWDVGRMLGVTFVDKFEKYLGLSCLVSQDKKYVFASLCDKIKSRIASWNNRFLSIRGREVFVMSTLQAIPTYTMNCFLLPKSFCRELESLLAKFWWQKSGEKKGIHWCS